MRIVREPINTFTHGAGFLLACVFTLVLVWRFEGHWTVVVFGLSMMLAYLASTLYHGLPVSSRTIARLERFDHSAIFVLIAGTYTPILWAGFEGWARLALLALIWATALAGVVIKSATTLPKWLSLGIYVLMGWFAAALLPRFFGHLPSSAVVAMVTGGVLYTLGVPFFAWHRQQRWFGKISNHEIWHLFVMAGSVAHFVMVMLLPRLT